jgi:hypothetical protein
VVAGSWLAGTLAALTSLGIAPAVGARPPAQPLQALVVTDVGAGYAVSFDGPPADASFATGWANPPALTSALAARNGAEATHERAWRDRKVGNSVQILLLRFPSAPPARQFATLAGSALESPSVVSSGPLQTVPGARMSTYVTSAGFGQAVVLGAGDYVALLSFVSVESPRAAPITAADAGRVVEAQRSALAHASVASVAVAKNGPTLRQLTWAVLAVAVVAGGVITPLVLRRRRERRLVAGRPAGSAKPSDGSAATVESRGANSGMGGTGTR